MTQSLLTDNSLFQPTLISENPPQSVPANSAVLFYGTTTATTFAIPAVGGTTTIGSLTLSQPTSGVFALSCVNNPTLSHGRYGSGYDFSINNTGTTVASGTACPSFGLFDIVEFRLGKPASGAGPVSTIYTPASTTTSPSSAATSLAAGSWGVFSFSGTLLGSASGTLSAGTSVYGITAAQSGSNFNFNVNNGSSASPGIATADYILYKDASSNYTIWNFDVYSYVPPTTAPQNLTVMLVY